MFSTLKERVFAAGFAAMTALILTACTSNPPGPDLSRVAERTEQAMIEFSAELERAGTAEEATPEQMARFEDDLTYALNEAPQIYANTIGIDLASDGSFSGYNDANGNMTQDMGETDLFTVEIDTANRRMILTEEGGTSTGFPFASAGLGFLAGALIGNLLGRQQRAGIAPSSFNNRSVQSASQYSQTRAAQNNARSRARSGGPSRGK